MPRRVDEGDLLALHLHLVGADVLGDATGLAVRNVGLADGVQDAGLAVVDVAHDGDRRRPGLQVGGLLLDLLALYGDRFLFPAVRLELQLAGHGCRRLIVHALVDGGHDAVLHEFLDHLYG